MIKTGNMECPKCKVEMKKGSLTSRGGYWVGGGFRTAMMGMFGKNIAGDYSVAAYNCPKCGKIELKTESDN